MPSRKTTPLVKQIQMLEQKMSNWVGVEFVAVSCKISSNMLKPLLSEAVIRFMTIGAFIAENTLS